MSVNNGNRNRYNGFKEHTMRVDEIERGQLGVKTGKGFYDWTPDSAEALRQRIAHALVEVEKWSRTS